MPDDASLIRPTCFGVGLPVVLGDGGRARPPFGAETAEPAGAIQLLHLVLRDVARRWKMEAREWTGAETQFAVLFGGRFSIAACRMIADLPHEVFRMKWTEKAFRYLQSHTIKVSHQAAAQDFHGGPRGSAVTFDDLAETPASALLPPLDRQTVDEHALTAEQRAWRREGVVILRRFIPDDVLDLYIARREKLKAEAPEYFKAGWYCPSPYEHIPELRELSLHLPLMRMLEHLIGEPMMLHLNLTGWVSTERNWHQDDYLNPPHVNSWYAAVWIALDHIDSDCGPFEYIPGSHHWPLLRQRRVLGHMTEAEAGEKHPVSGALVWPKTSESFVVPAIEAEIARRGATICQFLAEKGDVLIWHGRLMHRGSLPRAPDRLRRALIAHYSGVNHRSDMRNRATDANGMVYAVAGNPLW